MEPPVDVSGGWALAEFAVDRCGAFCCSVMLGVQNIIHVYAYINGQGAGPAHIFQVIYSV